MIGVFDSGDGGLCTVEMIKRLSPGTDVCFLADRKNAPYGTKTKDEIIALTKNNIRKLRNAGADKILIACCTASTVFPFLSDEEKEIAIPIIDATAALAASKTKTKRIGVIATRATVLSGAFRESVKRIIADAEVIERETQELVGLVEGGARDGSVTAEEYEKLERILSEIKTEEFDTLILGCTHFPRLKETISEIVGRETVSSVEAGALEILKYCTAQKRGITLYI